MKQRGRKSAAALSIVAGQESCQRPEPSRWNPVDVLEPPRPLGTHGAALWASVLGEFELPHAGLVEALAQACAALDRAEACRKQIDQAGELVNGREHPLLKIELASRAFVTRTLQRLELK